MAATKPDRRQPSARLSGRRTSAGVHLRTEINGISDRPGSASFDADLPWPRSAHDAFLLEALANATKPDCVMITEQVLPQAGATLARLGAGARILDIGAGGGHHVIHYARRFPHARVVGLESDLPSIELARRALDEAGIDDRVEIRASDANDLEDEDVFDLVTLDIALHETGDHADQVYVLNRVRRALKPNGTVVVSELPYPDSPQEYRGHPVYKVMAGVQVHEALVGCGRITQGQLATLLTAPSSPVCGWPSSPRRRAWSCWARSRASLASCRSARPVGADPHSVMTARAPRRAT